MAAEGRFAFDGGHITLDLANTVDWHASDHPEERLTGYQDVVDWGVEAGLLNENGAKGYRQLAAPEADQAHRRTVLLREVAYRIFAAVARGQEPVADDIDLLCLFLQVAMTHARLVTDRNVYQWKWSADDQELAAVLGPVAQGAVDLLRSDQLDRVGQCADDRGCGWLFFDSSRNRSRRWCSMESCGNRAKARRHYRRAQGAETPSG